jgi:sortase A
MTDRWPSLTPTRVVGAVGRLLILVGVLVLAFVAYQLWGTGLQEARAQDRLDRQFRDALAQSAATPTTTTADGSVTTTIPPDGEAADPANDTPAAIENGDAIARLQIDKIGLDKLVVQGTGVPDLRKGPGHYAGTPMPGASGNVAIAGHRTTYGAPFGDIDQLAPGDLIELTTLGGKFEYRVLSADKAAPGRGEDPTSGHFVVKPTDVFVLGDFGDNRLTLTACHPKYSARERIVVAAELVVPVSETSTTATTVAPVGTTQPPSSAASAPDLDQGLGGDPHARTAAILWGLAFFAALAGVWQLSQRWYRWPAYAAGALPLVVVLYVWFENLDRWMPAR